MNGKCRVVVDTNLVISGAIAAGSLPDQVLAAWERGDYIWVISTAIFREISDVIQRDHIRKKYHISDARVARILVGLRLGATFVEPADELPLHSRDFKDDKFLAC